MSYAWLGITLTLRWTGGEAQRVVTRHILYRILTLHRAFTTACTICILRRLSSYKT